MDYIRYPVHIVESGKSRLAEEAVLRNIVNEIYIRIACCEELLIVDEVIYYSVAYVLHDSHIVVSLGLAEIHVEFSAVDHLVLILLGYAGITRKNYADIAVLLNQSPRQSVHYIAQAAGLDEREAL